jgi:hypothetical protein
LRKLRESKFTRRDLIFHNTIKFTYINESLNSFSKIDYFVFNDVHVYSFEITDPDVNFSDHVPILIRCIVNICSNQAEQEDSKSRPADLCTKRLRWDRAVLDTYFAYTQSCLQPILEELCIIEADEARYNDVALIDAIYDRLIVSINMCAEGTVPTFKQNFFKFWWNQELDCLKESSVDPHRLWTASGRPRSGPIFNRRN